MATTPWHQGSQPLEQNNGYYQQPAQQPVQQPIQQPVQRRKTNPPPVCFNCGVEGHFLVACPQATQNTPGGFTPTPRPYQQVPGPNLQSQPYPPQAPPIQHPPYQPTLQYGNTGQHYSYNQPQPQQPPQTQQPYGQPQQFGQPQQYGQPGFQPSFQPPPYNQYPPNGPPQFSTPVYQGPPQFAPSAPYQQPSNSYPTQNSGYGAPYQAPPVPYQQPQPQSQWNHTPPATRPPYHQQQRRNSSQRGHSGTPSHQMQRRRSRSQQVDHSSESIHPTPETPASVHGSANQPSRRGSLITPDAKPEDESKVSSRASTPYGRYGSGDDMPLDDPNTVPTSSASHNYAMDKPEDGEEGEVDDEALFNWEFKQIFKEPPRDETVALAQPLSANFKSTPVPLVQAWSMDVPSISRYARKDNLKDFVRPIRELPQWSYLQEDPAFSDKNQDGPSITFEDLPFWITAHHQEMDMQANEELQDESLEHTLDEPTELSRKRGRSYEAESSQNSQGQENDEVVIEGLRDQDDGSPRAKRIKNVAERDEDEIMQTPTARTPVIGYRSGTPCVETEGDAWAPEPGETASTPQNPTEALLASLGVTGSPKPVKKEPIPAYMNNLEEQPRRKSSQPLVDSQQTPHPPPVSQPVTGPPVHSYLPQDVQHGHPTNSENGPPSNNQHVPPINHQNDPHMNVSNQQGPQMNNQNGPQMNMNNQQGPPMHGHAPQYGPPTNAPYGHAPAGNFPQGHQSYGPPANVSYQNGPPQNYGQPANASYVNGPPPPNNYGPPQQGQPHWAPPQHQSYNHGQHNASHGYAPYPQQQNGPYGNPQYAPVTNVPYQNPPGPHYPPGPPQYGPQSNPSFGNAQPIHGTYGPPTQGSPTQYFPPQNGNYGSNGYLNDTPQPPYNQNPTGPPYPNPNGPQNNNQFPNGQPHQPFRGPNGSAPPRQDSGYMSARGSYSNDTGPQGFNGNHGHPVPPIESTMDGASSPSLEKSLDDVDNMSSQQMTRKDSDTGSRATDSTGTPLSPTSMEILGKLERKSSHTKSGDQKKAKDAARKSKRPQPVVAEAYSRRW
ncbi:hypothetical protein DL95DRAFT_86878 [Leptodontidium sp. 2 PMI_412]|nr:hypothetical protein DL95DRAFT_86878 [Leptodontidium sp. 2 PMI_412]